MGEKILSVLYLTIVLFIVTVDYSPSPVKVSIEVEPRNFSCSFGVCIIFRYASIVGGKDFPNICIDGSGHSFVRICVNSRIVEKNIGLLKNQNFVVFFLLDN